MEKFNHSYQPETPLNLEVTDYEDEPFYPLLQKLPRSLALKHIAHIENNSLSEDETIIYLEKILASRHEATTSSEISDVNLQEIFKNNPELLAEVINSLETSVFNNPDNYLGTGMTAKVKHYNLTDPENTTTIPMAIKYVITPTAKTLTAEQEHDVIKEVERMKTIEDAQLKNPRRSRYLRVPHPYLHHSNEKLQLYSMEHIDGANLYQLTNGGLTQEFKQTLRESRLAEVSMEEMDGYVERFFTTMHEYCLHGDIKPANLMVNSDGVLYVIDFGQSISPQNIPKGAEEQFENLKEDEIKEAKLCIRRLLRLVFSDD